MCEKAIFLQHLGVVIRMLHIVPIFDLLGTPPWSNLAHLEHIDELHIRFRIRGFRAAKANWINRNNVMNFIFLCFDL